MRHQGGLKNESKTAHLNRIILHEPTEKVWLDFGKPLEVFSTSNIEEVLPIVEKVEDYVNNKGLYAAGFLSYEASAAFDAALTTFPSTDFPLITFGIFNEPTKLTSLPDTGHSITPTENQLKFQLPFSKEGYKKQLSKVRDYIQIGDTYQVNFTFRQRAKFDSNPYQLFQKIGKNALFGAYLDLDDFAICSASPELFFRVENGVIESRPMKGTMQRGRTLVEDLSFKNQLQNSQKDRSENVMIVDMIRNDMGKIAETGTVQTPKLFEVEKHPTVWQMTSTVEAKTKATFSEILKALFPCASITGAPKVRTMEIIRALEDSPRNIYCGTIGYLAPNGKMQFNVSIRTALIDKKTEELEYGIGGGITWYSDSEKEFEEAILKSKIIRKKKAIPEFSLLETILWTPEKGFFLLDEHLKRLTNSAEYFDYKIDLNKIKSKLLKEVSLPHHSNDERTYSPNLKVRLLISKNGRVFIEKVPIKTEDSASKNKPIRKITFANNPVDSSNPFLFHKTTNRTVYEEAKSDFPNHYDVILWNEKGEITEGTFNNIVIRRDGKYLTPPIESGLLNGAFRQYLLDKGEISEHPILKQDLLEADAIFLINSVREWQQVALDFSPQVEPLLSFQLG